MEKLRWWMWSSEGDLGMVVVEGEGGWEWRVCSGGKM